MGRVIKVLYHIFTPGMETSVERARNLIGYEPKTPFETGLQHAIA